MAQETKDLDQVVQVVGELQEVELMELQEQLTLVVGVEILVCQVLIQVIQVELVDLELL